MQIKKPIIRWTIGHVKKSGYEILNYSIKSIKKLYSNEFEYYVCYNDIDKAQINKLKKYKINFIEQKWDDCPIKNIIDPIEINNNTKEKINGSLWKVCPPRLCEDVHEIILDNDLIFLKRPKIIDKFLRVRDKNLIIKDSNIYLGKYEKFFHNEKQGYNSGVIGLRPGYDFKKDIIKNYKLKNNKNFDYGNEQGLLTYALYKTNPLIGSAEDFVGLHPDIVYLNCLSNNFPEYKLEKERDTNKDKFIRFNNNMLFKIFNEAEVIHFLRSNRVKHKAWQFFKSNKCL